MSEPRKHHLVAQLYQRGFARKKGKSWQVRVIDRATGEGGVRSVRDVFAQRDWNTVVDEDGNKDFSVEELLAQYIDGPAAPALGELRRDRFPLTEWHRGALAIFMAAQLTRGRMPRENVSKFVVDVNRQVLRKTVANYTDEHWMRAIGEVPDEKTKRMFMDGEKHFDIRPTNALLLQTLLGPVGEVAEYVAKRTWTLVRFDEPCLFTGENPVVHIDPAGGEFGFGVATCEQMYMPVSTTHALVLSHPWTSWPEAVVNGTRQLAERLNWAKLNYPANRELLLHPDVARHPLPGVALLASAERTWWPWGGDPEARPRVPQLCGGTPRSRALRGVARGPGVPPAGVVRQSSVSAHGLLLPRELGTLADTRFGSCCGRRGGVSAAASVAPPRESERGRALLLACLSGRDGI